jgi:RNA polymerase sigma-70 factor (ECF subfamily)
MAQEDITILELLSADDESALDLLFDHYYGFLCNVVFRVINDAVYAEDIVQEMFTDIWHKRHEINIKTSLRAYLRRAAVNRSLNHIRKQRMKFDETEEAVISIEAQDVDGQMGMERDELEKRIFDCIENLPPKCKLIFGMSRFENMSYQEIADSLDISIKTVENQISKALKLLRQTVQHYLV